VALRSFLLLEGETLRQQINGMPVSLEALLDLAYC
jgi:hypothetical protein